MPSSPKTKPTKVILYARVSSAEQKNRQTIESQPPELERLLQGLDGPVEVIPAPDGSRYWLDEGRSGRTLHRRVLGTMLDQLESGEVQADAIVTVKVDRLFRRSMKNVRSLDDCHRIERTLVAHDVRILTTRGYVDPTQVLLYNVETGMSSQENEDRTERVIRAMKKKLKEGTPIWGHLPYGYRTKPDDPEHPRRAWSIVIDPVRATHVRQIAGWVIEGGCAHAARRATEEGIPRPSGKAGSWDQGYLWRLFVKKADRYLGVIRYTYQGEEATVKVPAILDRDTYLRLRAATATKAKPRGKRVHAFSGALRCPGCGHTMQIHVKANPKDMHRAYLSCQFCRVSARYDGELERWLWTAAGTWAMVLAGAEVQEAQGNGLEGKLADARAALRDVREGEGRLVHLHRKGMLSLDAYEKEWAPIHTEMQTLEAKIATIQSSIAERDRKAQDEAGVLDRAYSVARKMKATKDPRGRNQLLRDLLGTEKIAFSKQGDRIRITFPKKGTVDPWTVTFGEPVRYVVTIRDATYREVAPHTFVEEGRDTIELHRDKSPDGNQNPEAG